MGCLSSTDSEAFMNPEKVDLSHFLVGSCIGKGGFGKVHAVMHKGTGVQMAMKRLEKSKIVGKAWHCNAVWVERNLLELLQNPYTNRLFFAFQSPWELFLIMPYYRGGDLNWVLNARGKLKTPQVQYYAAEMTLALAELRRLKVVYRDLKPENCLFNDDGHICITDFGIAGQLTEENGFKLADRFGTTPYMSPEQYRGKPYDYCCDYFAFGLCLVAMATGKMLHRGPKRDIDAETDDWYRTKLGGISSMTLKSLIQSLLTVNREHRLGVADVQEIFNHKFFASINWEDFASSKQLVQPPYVPDVKQLNCSLEQLAMDAMVDDDPTDSKPPKAEEQSVFDEFQFNTEPKKEWVDHWQQVQIRKDSNSHIQSLWDKAVDTNAFDQPKSELPFIFENIHIEIKRSMSVQIPISQNQQSLVSEQ